MPRHHFKRCAIPSCAVKNTFLKKFGIYLRFFSFPRNEASRNEWLIKCNKNLNELTDNDAVCSRHFHMNDYTDGLESKFANVKPKRLKPDAVPSLLLDRGPQLHSKCNNYEYHKVIAQEILNEEMIEASKSNDPPIYLEFSQSKNVAHKSGSPKSSMETDTAQHFDGDNSDTLDGVEDYILPDDKEDSVKQTFECHVKNNKNKNVVKNEAEADNFVGRCYVCDKNIRQSDRNNFSQEDFTKVVQKVLEGISTEYVIVTTPDDGLCGACRNVVTRISKLEAELRTATLGLRALLRLNYSLPPPSMVPERKEPSEVQAKVECSSRTETGNNSVEQKTKPIVEQKNKITQTLVIQRHKKTQTSEKVFEELSTSKIVGSINQVEYLEAEEMQEEDFENTNELSVQYSAVKEEECLFEDITDATELEILLNDDFLAEESEVVTESREPSNSLETVDQPENQRPAVTRKNLGMLKCAKCSFRTNSSEEMKVHMSSFLNKEGFFCYICDYSFHVADHFHKHSINHPEISQNKRCIFCDAAIHDKLHMKYHIEANHKPNPFHHQCSKCNRVFAFAHLMRKHLRSDHKMVERYTCDTCKRVFGDKIKFDNHVEYYHRPSLTCKFCQRQYSTVKQLIVHENSAHRFDRTHHYQCSYCTRKFVRQELLQRHEEHHTGSYDYRCALCGYGFNEGDKMEKHQKLCARKSRPRRNPITPRKPPSPANSWRAVVKKRLRKFSRDPLGGHKSSVCDVCGKVINSRSNYKIHREMHNSPSCFQCHMCGRKFRYKDNMRAHIRNLHKEEDSK